MHESLFSSSWYRVAELKPRLRAHARIHRHLYRGEPWYVLEDVVNQRVHRFTPATHGVIGLMDGERTVHDLWEIATETLGDDAPTQDEMIRLLAQLHGADVLQCDVPPDSAELLQRFEKREKQEWQQKLMSPLSLRVRLFDPDLFLRKLAVLIRPLMNKWGALLWMAVVVPAFVMAGMHWTELTENVLDRVMTAQNLILIWLLFPVIKALHELGHGAMARYYGGEVHDMGVMFLVFTPVPYVDASTASAFPERRQRALVSAGGMIVEVFLAALAFYVWVAAEPGAVRTVAYNAILIGGFTTLTFNANPLLRFDGYYILADLLEIPNLRQRANAYVSYLAEFHALGNKELTRPEAIGTESFWLVFYAVAAFIYRVFIIGVIMMFVLGFSVPLGVLIIAISAVGWLGKPLWKGVKFLLNSPRLQTVRGRAIAVTVGTVASLLFLVFILPLPFRTATEGVVWVPDEALVRAESGGFVTQLVAQPDGPVRKGDALIECRDPDLDAAVQVLQARIAGLEAREKQVRVESVARAEMFAEEIHHLDRRLLRARERQADLVIRAGRDGIFVVPHPEDLVGRYVEQGELLAHVVQLDSLKVRAVVPQEDIELLVHHLDGVEVRRTERLDEILPAQITHLVLSATGALPHPALGTQGGGALAVDPRDERGMHTVAPFFEVEVDVPLPPGARTIGGRVYLRFDHGYKPIAWRWYRSLRQLFLSRLNV
jgi:putative peptide zinc metalloprotease protein